MLIAIFTHDAFVAALGDKARVELYVHHYSPRLLNECLTTNFVKFHYYVVMRHFFELAEEWEYLDAVSIASADQLVLIDKRLPSLPGVTKAVFQDFKVFIKEALQFAGAMFRNYKAVSIIFPLIITTRRKMGRSAAKLIMSDDNQ